METEAETGGTRPPARGRLEPPEVEEAGRPLPGACGGSTALGHLDLRHPVSRTGANKYLWFKPLGSETCITAATGHRSEGRSENELGPCVGSHTWLGSPTGQRTHTPRKPVLRQPSAARTSALRP